MKRFLILSISIVFVTVSCAGPNKVKVYNWKKPDFRQDQFDKDSKDCGEQSFKVRTYESNGNVVTGRVTLEECLQEKGYELVAEEVEAPREPLTVGKVLLTATKVTVAVEFLGLMALGGRLPI